MDADNRPTASEVRPLESPTSCAKGKEDQAMLTAIKPQTILLTSPWPNEGSDQAVRQAPARAVGGSSGSQVAATLRRSFLRRAKQSANYLEKQLQKLDDGEGE